MEAKYIFFNKLELDSNHRFSVDFEKRNTSLQEIFHYKFKSFCEISCRINKVVEISNFCWILIDENEKGFSLKEIENIVDQRGFANKIEIYKLDKKILWIQNINFMIQWEKNQVNFYLFTIEATNWKRITL